MMRTFALLLATLASVSALHISAPMTAAPKGLQSLLQPRGPASLDNFRSDHGRAMRRVLRTSLHTQAAAHEALRGSGLLKALQTAPAGGVSQECSTALQGYDGEKCANAFDTPGPSGAAAQEAALCGTGGCIEQMRGLLRACSADFASIDPSGTFKKLAFVLNGMQELCPKGDRPGCFASAATWGERMAKINTDGGNIPSDADLAPVCDDKCSGRIIKFFLYAARLAGATDADIATVRAVIRGQEILCQRDSSGKLCYSEFRAAIDKGLKPETICQKGCIRKSFALYIELLQATTQGQREVGDFLVLFRVMCARNKAKKFCYSIFDDNPACKDIGTQVQACFKEAEKVEGCAGKVVDANGQWIGQTAPCQCADAVVACQVRDIPKDCISDEFYNNCKTGIQASCVTGGTCAPFLKIDPCADVMEAQTCTAECKADAQKVVEDMGCCLGTFVKAFDRISSTGSLAGLRGFSGMIKAIKEKCTLTADLTASCPKASKVTGKAGIRGLKKKSVDDNKDKYYNSFKSDMSTNSGVDKEDINVTGHEELAAKRQATGAGVTFNYELALDDDTAANEVKANIDKELADGTLDLPAVEQEAAVTDPGAEITVDTSASQTTSTGTPSGSGAGGNSTNSTATAVAVSVLALTPIAFLL